MTPYANFRPFLKDHETSLSSFHAGLIHWLAQLACSSADALLMMADGG
jgi:hypothetical protein